MNFIKTHKNKIILIGAIIAALTFAFWWGGGSPGLRGFQIDPNNTVSETIAPKIAPESIHAAGAETPEKTTDENAARENEPEETKQLPISETEKTGNSKKNEQEKAPSASEPGEITGETGIDPSGATAERQAEPAAAGQPVSAGAENAAISEPQYTCTLSVRCDSALKNISWLEPGKAELIPKDGIIFAEQTVPFYEGESVFNLLSREMKRNKIHLEFENTPMYKSVYIEGIGNLYEFDCGELSGWMYKVNGSFPNYGCSLYQLKAGDKVEWVYTCDFGVDVGGHYSAMNGK